MYPRNAVSPPRIAVGAVIQISDGAVQTSGVSVSVRPNGGSETSGAGTVSYGSSGIVYYAPTQGETDYTDFVVVASKTGCIPVAVTIVTSASATAGRVVLSAETHTGAVVPTVTTLTNDPSGVATLLSRVTGAVMLAASYSSPPSAATIASQVRIELAAELARIDAAISSRLASGSYTAPLDAAAIRAAIGLALDNLDMQLAALAGYIDTEVSSILAAVDTEVAAIKAKTDQMTFSVIGRIDASSSGGDATAANQTTIINHLVAMKGGGFSGSTDSLEAISDAVAGLAVSSGSGAYTVTITVNDGTTALQGAIVRVTEGVTTITGTTNASGVVVFALDAASWSLAITKPGYSYTPTTLTVSGTASFTRSMTAVSIDPPAGPGLSTGTIICYGTDGLPESGAKVYVRLVSGPGDAGAALDGGELTLTANGSGVATHTGFVRGGAYKARRGTAGTWVSFVVPDADSFDISELVGSP